MPRDLHPGKRLEGVFVVREDVPGLQTFEKSVDFVRRGKGDGLALGGETEEDEKDDTSQKA
ncbi:hypothetical protein D3C83_179080 [compost metagenome]